jgi:hypothetical protein
MTFGSTARRRCEVLAAPRMLLEGKQSTSLMSVKKGFLALLALALALHAAGFTCGLAPAEAALKAPCCGSNCPAPSSAGDRACCQVQSSSADAEALSAKPNISSFRPFAGSIQAYAVMPMTRSERASVFQASPPGAANLALLCSRQI